MWKTLVKQFDSTDSIVSLVLGLAVVLVIGMTVVNYVKSKTQPAASTTQEAAKKQQMPLLFRQNIRLSQANHCGQFQKSITRVGITG